MAYISVPRGVKKRAQYQPSGVVVILMAPIRRNFSRDTRAKHPEVIFRDFDKNFGQNASGISTEIPVQNAQEFYTEIPRQKIPGNLTLRYPGKDTREFNTEIPRQRHPGI